MRRERNTTSSHVFSSSVKNGSDAMASPTARAATCALTSRDPRRPEETLEIGPHLCLLVAERHLLLIEGTQVSARFHGHLEVTGLVCDVFIGSLRRIFSQCPIETREESFVLSCESRLLPGCQLGFHGGVKCLLAQSDVIFFPSPRAAREKLFLLYCDLRQLNF